MPASASTIKKVIQKHLEELGFLWRQRTTALRSPDWQLGDIKRLDSRIEPHLDGLRIAATGDVAAMAANLKGDDPWTIVAASVALLQLQTKEAAQAVVDALLATEPKQADAFRRALVRGPIDLIEEQLRAAADTAPPHVAATAVEVLLYHGRRGAKTERLAEFVRHEDPTFRAAGWRIAALSEGP
jgi:uncharacterized protein (TIGR02270 family)